MPDGAAVAVAAQFLKIDIADNNGIDIGIAFPDNAVPGKAEIGGGKDPGLGILDIHVFHVGQVADCSRNTGVHLVFNGRACAQ